MRKEDAMSLISIVITIVIIVILTSITLTTGISVLEDSREKAAQDKMVTVYNAILADETKIKVGEELLIDVANIQEGDNKIITADELVAMGLKNYAEEEPFQEIHLIKSTVYTQVGEETVTYTFKIEKKKAGEFYEYIGTTTTKVEVLLGEPSFNVKAGVNRPQLTTDMIALKMKGSALLAVADVYTEEWYDYLSSSKQWANMRYKDDIYVWIPRFAYKIQEHYINEKFENVPEKVIDIIFLRETSNYPANGEILPSGYSVHSAFSVDGNEYAGIWVQKDVEGRTNSISTAVSNSNNNQINNEHTVSIESHLMTNSEWGAIAYLAHTMSQGKSATVPNNASGIEALNDKQYVFAYLEGNEITFNKPADMYISGDNVYTVNKDRKGDAMFETSADPTTITNAAWYNSLTTILSNDNPFIIRGGDSLFEYESTDGQKSNTAYRKVVYIDNI